MSVGDDAGFLGRGWAFPPRFDLSKGEVAMVAREDDIEESLRILFLTRRGERVMQPTYGCALQDMVFQGNTAETRAAVKQALARAILFHETRIDVISIDLRMPDPLEGRMEILLEYRIRSTNSRTNVVFPFYLSEGTLLPERPAGA
jgi:uncharacterized protein